MNAELAARRTVAQAVLGDFSRAQESPWYWADRLAAELRSMLEITGQEMSCDDKDSVKRDNVHEA